MSETTNIEVGDLVRIKPDTAIVHPEIEQARGNGFIFKVEGHSAMWMLSLPHPGGYKTYECFDGDELEPVDETVWKIDGLCPNCGHAIYHLDFFYGQPCNQWHCETCGYGEVSDNAPKSDDTPTERLTSFFGEAIPAQAQPAQPGQDTALEFAALMERIADRDARIAELEAALKKLAPVSKIAEDALNGRVK